MLPALSSGNALFNQRRKKTRLFQSEETQKKKKKVLRVTTENSRDTVEEST